MSEPNQPPSSETLPDLLDDGDHETAISRLEATAKADPERRKETLRELRAVADDRPTSLEPLVASLAEFLTDEERAVRLTTAKLFVAVAEADPDATREAVEPLAARLADDEEFYYVRARSAEALGYIALEHPETVASPELLADLRIGLSFDEPEVKEKLAKALEHVALGDPDRLRYQVSSLAEHLEDENDLVRYHLTTALVVVGCEHPGELADASAELTARLEEENTYVRGRAAEALGLLAGADPEAVPLDAAELPDGVDFEASFAVERLAFAQQAIAGENGSEKATDEVGSVEGIRGTTDELAAEIAAPDGNSECPHCGLSLPADGPPMCPQCGAPY
jgi:hypothetical protein